MEEMDWRLSVGGGRGKEWREEEEEVGGGWRSMGRRRGGERGGEG